MEALSQGAEARVFKASLAGTDVIAKERFPKRYRHPVLDTKLTTRRLLQEARSLFRCAKAGLDVPTLYFVDTAGNLLYMEQIRGVSVKYHIDSRGTSTDLASRIGTFLASMHDLDIIHGDLTSSNMMLREETSSLVIIDFGLSSVSSLAEDKAVDLYVLERALASAHGDVADFFHEVLVVYKSKSKIGKQVLQKLDEVRLRGRKRDMTG